MGAYYALRPDPHPFIFCYGYPETFMERDALQTPILILNVIFVCIMGSVSCSC